MHLPLRLIFCRRCLNFINVRAAYASKIQAPPTKNPLANSGTTRFREHIKDSIIKNRRNYVTETTGKEIEEK